MRKVYFLTEEERKRLLKGLLPKSREVAVAEELRGWNWHQPPLEPIYDVRLALYEVAGKYCPTGRDVFLRRVMKIKVKPNKAMVAGGVFHETLTLILVMAKKLLYEKGVGRHREALEALREPRFGALTKHADALSETELADLRDKVILIWDFEYARIAARVQEALAKQPYIGEDSLVTLAIPVVIEQKLDGSFLGLSQNLSADALMFAEPMVLDLKFGEKQRFHQLTTTGYGLVMEAIYEFPVNVGCVTYVDFRENRVLIEREFHLIGDELRQWFVEERDEKMRMVYEEIDPGVGSECRPTCPYYETCRA